MSKRLSSDSYLDFSPDEVGKLAARHSVVSLISAVDQPLPKQFRLEGPSLHM
jgi:hypothetical protein